LVGNKADSNDEVYDLANNNIIYISALQQKNIDTLKQSLFVATVQDDTLSEQTIVTNARHIAALEKVNEIRNRM
jgi:tRNA modification GTPase